MAEFQPIKVPRRAKDLTGKQFGKWTVLKFAGITLSRAAIWLCRCDCGTERYVAGHKLSRTSHASRSCGCAKRGPKIKHGMSGTKAYRVWASMIHRCNNPKSQEFHNYGARGISVCQRWHQFAGFYADMGDPRDGLSLERIDNSKGYCKENCCWATLAQQMRNTRQNRNLTFHGRTQCLMDWATETGIGYGTLEGRLRLGWSIEQALTAPLHSRRKKKLESSVIATSAHY